MDVALCQSPCARTPNVASRPETAQEKPRRGGAESRPRPAPSRPSSRRRSSPTPSFPHREEARPRTGFGEEEGEEKGRAAQRDSREWANRAAIPCYGDSTS